MAKITVDTSEIDKMIKNIKRVQTMLLGGRGRISPVLKRAFDKIGEKILADVIKETPVGDSTRPDFHETSQFHEGRTHLKDSWKWKLKIKGAVVEGYTHVVSRKLDNLVDLLEAGSPSHPIRPKSGSVLRFYTKSSGGWEEVYTKEIVDPEHPGFPANKFTDRAQHKADEYVEELVTVLQSEINRIISGK